MSVQLSLLGVLIQFFLQQIAQQDDTKPDQVWGKPGIILGGP